MHYHLDIKHNVYWDVEEQVLKQSSQHSEEKIYSEAEITIKTEPFFIASMIKCNFCEKTFATERGLLVHTSKTHKEEYQNIKTHQEEYQNKRKCSKEENTKCYICGFTFTSEATFQVHTEENQEYIIQRSDSITKSPQNKKAKEFQIENMEVDQSDIIKLKMKRFSNLNR